jgi:hypothetical protein
MIETGTGLMTGLRGNAWGSEYDPAILNGAGSNHEKWHAVQHVLADDAG